MVKKIKPHTEVEVWFLPKCDFCDKKAGYDAQTSFGAWGNMCEHHFLMYGGRLGIGYGQRLKLKGKTTPVKKTRNPSPAKKPVSEAPFYGTKYTLTNVSLETEKNGQVTIRGIFHRGKDEALIWLGVVDSQDEAIKRKKYYDKYSGVPLRDIVWGVRKTAILKPAGGKTNARNKNKF